MRPGMNNTVEVIVGSDDCIIVPSFLLRKIKIKAGDLVQFAAVDKDCIEISKLLETT